MVQFEYVEVRHYCFIGPKKDLPRDEYDYFLFIIWWCNRPSENAKGGQYIPCLKWSEIQVQFLLTGKFPFFFFSLQFLCPTMQGRQRISISLSCSTKYRNVFRRLDRWYYQWEKEGVERRSAQSVSQSHRLRKKEGSRSG